jgi:DNA-binding beta-propeller fold protein YncE
LAALASPPNGGYHLLKSVPIGAAPGDAEYFDYVTVDPAGRRVYIAHGAEVKVLDADNFAVVGSITGLKKCHGVALVPELNKGFITDGDEAKVVVFDIKTLKITGEVKTAPDTDSLTYDPASKMVFTFNGSSKNASAIDSVKETLVKTIDMGGGPEQPVADGKGTIYDNNKDTNEVVAIDTHTLTIKTRWSVKPAGQAVAISLDPEHHRVFSAGRNPATLVMMDADSGKVLQSFPISAGVDASSYDPATGLVFCSTRAGVLHVFHADSSDKLTPVEEVKTEYGAKTMGLDLKTHNVFLVTADFTPPSGPQGDRKAIKGTARVLIYGL